VTERQWLAARTAAGLIDHPVCRDRRKLRLLATACARRMLPALQDDPAFRDVVDAAERYAGDPAARSDAVAARKPVRDAARRLGGPSPREPLAAAVNVLIALTGDALEGHTAGIANALYVIGHRSAVVRADGRTERGIQADYLRDIFGNPFRPIDFSPSWRTDTVMSLAKQVYESHDFAAIPILADALQDAGCDSEEILRHCRDPNQVHVRGCWVVDLVLGKE
jgi:hypothetical protein